MTTVDSIDLNLLRVFDAIAKERSLTRAGERLALSQPAISYSLGRLRLLFGDTLFVRTRTGMQPTPLAVALESPISRALMTLRDALRYGESFDAERSKRAFRLSLSDAGELVYLPPICSALNRLAPNVKITVDPLPYDSVEEGLRSNRIDFAIGNLPGLRLKTRAEVLFQESYVCITRARADLPSGHAIDIDYFLSASHVHIPSQDRYRQSVDSAYRLQGVDRDIALEVPHFSALPKILAVRDIVATVPRRLASALAARDGRLRIYEPPVPLPKAEISLHWHENFDAEGGNIWLRGLLSDVIRKSCQPGIGTPVIADI
ncbi:LysR family transcriptional regulator [Pandoraea sputorum]|uniref:LysR family transcriptional regulator n=1 Tax=Pandoraea sputorum TaxID=93222 RepID=UPI00123F961B|nr:LysR family transcriptional regulator [Pandoraea sputorum]VVE85470.1 LysR family transcriptional regulator [Pandoraea sputorum]